MTFNQQKQEIRTLTETAWLKPYYEVYREIDARIETPERLTYQSWLKELNSKSGVRFWSDCIKSNLGLDEFTNGWTFKWGNATFHLNDTDLSTIYTFWKATNKRI